MGNKYPAAESISTCFCQCHTDSSMREMFYEKKVEHDCCNIPLIPLVFDPYV
jgi:hypothetical protein